MVAPAGVPEAAALESGLALLAERYTVTTFRDLTDSPSGMLAGNDELRARELRWALTDPDIRCVIAARGGYGTARVLGPDLVGALARSPRLIVGFSDITALLAASFQCAGLRGVHGPMVCQLGRRGKAWSAFSQLLRVLEDPTPRPALDGLVQVVEGSARGPLVGGNLTVLTHLVGTPYLPSLRGAVLFIEDVGERPYRLDRCLTHLLQAGALEGVAGFVVGELTDCKPKGSEHPAQHVIESFCHELGVPAAMNLPVGHGQNNEPLPYGAVVDLDATTGTLTFLEGVVR